MSGLATLWGLGARVPAPGSIASALAVAAAVLLHGLGNFPLMAAATVAVTALAVPAIRAALAGGTGDPPEVVIDEVAGQWLVMCAPSAGFWMAGLDPWQFPWPGWLSAFLLFRLFDIAKPWPVSRAERLPGAAGVLADDLVAGALAGASVIALAALWHGAVAG